MRKMAKVSSTPEAGYTIQELLIVLIVGSLLVGFSFSLFLFVNRMFSTWHKTAEFRQQVQSAVRTIATDISRSRRVVTYSDSALVLEKPTGIGVVYAFDGRSIRRDGISVIADTSIACVVSLKRKTAGRDESVVLNIDVEGRQRMLVYRAGSDILVPKSSVQSFGGIQ